MMCAILQSKLKSNLKGRKSFHSSLSRSPSTHIGIDTHLYKQKHMTRVKELLVSHLRSSKGKKTLKVMVLGILKPLVLIKRPLPLES